MGPSQHYGDMGCAARKLRLARGAGGRTRPLLSARYNMNIDATGGQDVFTDTFLLPATPTVGLGHGSPVLLSLTG